MAPNTLNAFIFRSVSGMWLVGPVIGHGYGILRNNSTTAYLPTHGWHHRAEDGSWHNNDDSYTIQLISGEICKINHNF